VTAKVDLAATIEEVRMIDLKGVFLPQKRPLNRVERVEARYDTNGKRWPVTDLPN
jgi:hypothetical protein